MAEHHYHETKEVRPASTGTSTGTIAFIVGGLVVAVGLILFWVFGGSDIDTGAAGGGTDVEINATSDSSAGAAADEGADTGAAATADTGAAATADTDASDAAAGSSATTGDSGAAATTGADSGN